MAACVDFSERENNEGGFATSLYSSPPKECTFDKDQSVVMKRNLGGEIQHLRPKTLILPQILAILFL